MEQFFVYLGLVLFGLCLGSFAGATVWRLRAHELEAEKKDGEPVDDKEYKKLEKLNKTSLLNDHSKCLNCSYRLRFYDLIPLFSWIFLGGRCRKCRKPIGYFEPLIELGTAIFFVVSYALWPYTIDSFIGILQFVLWLLAGVVMAIMFAYDAKWSLLPDSTNFALIGIGVINSIIVVATSNDKLGAILNIIGGVLILSGLYLALYLYSKGKWIGFGDIKLGLGLALFLVDWQLAFIALFAANLIGCILVIPPMIAGKLKRNSHVPFGPLLIVGSAVAFLLGPSIINLFFSGLAF